jgi:hypothetical protein
LVVAPSSTVDLIAKTDKRANPVDAAQDRVELHNKKRMAPTAEPSTEANPEPPFANEKW